MQAIKKISRCLAVSLAISVSGSVFWLTNVQSTQTTFQMEVGESVSAAPIKLSPGMKSLLKNVGDEILQQGIERSIDWALTSRPANSGFPTPPVYVGSSYVGSYCKSQRGGYYFWNRQMNWWFYSSNGDWSSLSRPQESVACYANIYTRAQGRSFWMPPRPLFGYQVSKGWVYKQ